MLYIFSAMVKDYKIFHSSFLPRLMSIKSCVTSLNYISQISVDVGQRHVSMQFLQQAEPFPDKPGGHRLTGGLSAQHLAARCRVKHPDDAEARGGRTRCGWSATTGAILRLGLFVASIMTDY